MKIAVFMSNNATSGWNMGHGIVNTLLKMQHSVMSIPMPTEREAPQQMVDLVKKQAIPIEILKKQDVIIVSGPEHIGPWIESCYGREQWKAIDVPKAVWLHESCHREDYDIEFDGISWIGDEWFFPAIQDAEMHDQEMFAKGRSHFLPFGVDTDIFQPHAHVPNSIGDKPDKSFDVGFLGMVYQKRAIYLNALKRHHIPPIRTGMCMIQDIRGYDWPGSMNLLASNTREIKVFFNLPSLSRLLVAKVFEVMACGTFLLTPALPEDRGAHKNMDLFESGKHLVYYSASNLGLVAQRLREWSSPEMNEKREEIALAGCMLVLNKHSLRIRLAELLSKLRVAASV